MSELLKTVTSTGVPYIDCRQCDRIHPKTRNHCLGCGRASLFKDGRNYCLECIKEASENDN